MTQPSRTPQDRSWYAPRERPAPEGGVMAQPIAGAPPVEAIVWLVAEDVAALIGVSKMTVYRLVESGALRVFRPSPNNMRFQRSWVMDYIRQNSEGGLPISRNN